MPAHHNFICRTPKTDLKSTDFSAITEANDKSVWKLVGRRGLTCSHVVTYKIVNYEFVKFKNNGQPKYRKVARSCSMVPHISLSTEVYEQFYQSFFYWEKFDGYQNGELPSNQTVKTFSDKLQPYQHLPIDYLSNDYHFGIFTDNATVLIRFDGETQSFPIVFE